MISKTLSNLRDCARQNMEAAESLGDVEEIARLLLIKLCTEIAAQYGHEVGKLVRVADFAPCRNVPKTQQT